MMERLKTLEEKRQEFVEKLRAGFVGKRIVTAYFDGKHTLSIEFVDGTKIKMENVWGSFGFADPVVEKTVSDLCIDFQRNLLDIILNDGSTARMVGARLTINGFSLQTFECVDRTWSLAEGEQ